MKLKNARFKIFYSLPIFVFSIYNTLHIYAKNFSEINPIYVIIAILLGITINFSMFFALNFIIKDKVKSSLIVCIIIFLFYQSNWFEVFSSIYLFLFCLAFLPLLILKTDPKNLSKIIFFISLVLLCFNIFDIAKNFKKTNINNVTIKKQTKKVDSAIPDVYIIVLDSYPSTNVLEKEFGFDNKEFVDYLESKGFYVYEKMYSNYPKTVGSFASFTNFDYINNLDFQSTSESLNKSKLFFQAKTNGYNTKFIKTFSTFELNNSGYIDEVVDLVHAYSLEQYRISNLFFRFTIYENLFSPFDYTFMKSDDFWKLAVKALSNKSSVESQFVLTHILAPHFPYLRNEKGKLVNEQDFLSDSTTGEYKINKKACLEYLLYINKKTEQTIDELLETSKQPPYIIIMGDHGLRLHYYMFQENKDILKEKNTINSFFSTFVAIYSPKQNYREYKKVNSLVNFLITFSNDLFKTNYKLKPNRFFYIYSHQHSDIFEEIEKNCFEIKL